MVVALSHVLNSGETVGTTPASWKSHDETTVTLSRAQHSPYQTTRSTSFLERELHQIAHTHKYQSYKHSCFFFNQDPWIQRNPEFFCGFSTPEKINALRIYRLNLNNDVKLTIKLCKAFCWVFKCFIFSHIVSELFLYQLMFYFSPCS